MKPLIKLLLNRYVLIFIILPLIFIVAYIQFAPLPTYTAKKSIDYNWKVKDVSLEEGKKLVISICMKCHFNYSYETLAGRQHGNNKRLGSFWSGNITNDVETGIGNWTEDELFYFLKTGINKDGEYIFDMPKYPNLSDEDMSSLIAFLKSDDELVKPTKLYNPPPRYSFLTKGLIHFWLRPLKFNMAPVEPPDFTNSIAFGEYLATAKYSCFDCHSRHSMTNNYLEPSLSRNFFEGGNPHANENGEKIYTLNLTPDMESGIGKWSEEDFIKAMKLGETPNGEKLKDPMFPFPLLTENEILAIYDYLQSLEPVKNKY